MTSHDEPSTPLTRAPRPIGVAIAAHNGLDDLKRSLTALQESTYKPLHISLVDDGSTDGTAEFLQREHPDVHVIPGGGDLWWAGGTNLAIEDCMACGCSFVLLLNPDCVVPPDGISQLVETSDEADGAMVAAVVVEGGHAEKVFWAGTEWGALPKMPLVWSLRYAVRPGTPTSSLPPQPFATADTGGRGVLVPTSYFTDLGLFNAKVFPQYGADNDFGLRVRKAGRRILIDPRVKVELRVERSGQAPAESRAQAAKGVIKRLFVRRHGSALRTIPALLRRHVPWYAFLPSSCYWLSRNVAGYLSRSTTRHSH